MRIVVDVMGGDHGPEVIIEGAKQALESNAGITELFLVGREDEVNQSMTRLGLRDPRVKVVHASEVLTMEEKPAETLRRKKDASIWRAVELIKDGKGDALISPGNTGGIVVASTIRLRPLSGLERPCIATVIPAEENEFVLLDSGASVECTPQQLVSFAIMGSIYSREILGYKSPRVGVLSVGKEPNKGIALTIETCKLCEKVNLNFIGNVEGHDLFHNRVDVVVCDGFVGNIVLKTVESFFRGMEGWLRKELTKNVKRKIGALLVKEAFRTIGRRMHPDGRGGAPLLGLNGSIVKAHGSAKQRAIMNAIHLAAQAFQHHINDVIEAEIAQAAPRLNGGKA